tara:strand:+ start:454 stop:840 length:387 start_codon:yes stop_codon:yes gene_type:complete
MDKLIPEVIKRISEGYQMAEPEKVKWTGTEFPLHLARQAGEICELAPIDGQWCLLKAAYPDEAELMKTIDKLSVWFIRQEKWTIYQHTKAVFRSMNRILNDYGSDRRMQYLFIVLSLEITIEYTNANV